MSGGLSLWIETPCGCGWVPVLLPGVSRRARGADGPSVPSAGAPAPGEPGTEDGAHQNHRDTGWAGENRAGENWGCPAWEAQPCHGTDPQILLQQVVTESHKERAGK